jgi:hypothetical protein
MDTINEGLAYFGWKNREKVNELCSNPSSLSDNTVAPFLGTKAKYGRGKEKGKLRKDVRKYFAEHCAELVNQYYNDQFKKQYSNPYNLIARYSPEMPNKKLQLFFDTILNLPQYSMTWSGWLLFYPEGRQIIYDLFDKPEKKIALANLFAVLVKVYVMSEYDDHVFNREFISFIPRVEELIEGTPLEYWAVRKLLLIITVRPFLSAFESYLNSLHNPIVKKHTEEMMEKIHLNKNDLNKAIGKDE